MIYSNKYSVVKSSWGITIDITGNYEETNSAYNSIFIADNSLTEAEKSEITAGLLNLLERLTQKYSIEIFAVKFNICDFQHEGLYWAGREWLSKALNIIVWTPEATFNQKENKYIFTEVNKS